MTTIRPHNKKDPKYLENITFTVATNKLIDERDPFASNLFLGRYDEKQIMKMFDEVGIIEILHKKDYRNLIISIQKQDGYTSRLYLNFDSLDKHTRLIELIIREGIFRPNTCFISGYDFNEGLSMMLIEWLALQDPLSRFPEDKPRLPGQHYPGLGCLKNMQAMLYKMGKSIGNDAIIDIPEYFHAAAIYSRLYSEMYSRKYSFFSPVDAGQVKAMIRDLKDRPLSDVSYAVAFDCLINAKTGEKASWRPSEQVYPISKKIYQYVEDDRYKAIVEDTTNRLSFAINWEKYEHLKAEGIMDEV